MSNKQNADLETYAAKLLFQFRVIDKGKTNKRRLCEERIVLLQAKSPKLALKRAKSIGRKAQFDDHLKDRRIYFEFIGLMELMKVDIEEEVWWEFKEMISPMERRGKIIPSENTLDALQSKIHKKKRGAVRVYGID